MKKFLLFSVLIFFICLFLLITNNTKAISAVESKDNPIEVEELNDTVYALTNINLRTSPGMDGDIVKIAQFGDEFKRTGITKNGWSRFELPENEVVYSLSICFSLEKPDLTEKTSYLITGDRVQLPVSFISQLPQLPTGCEVTALTTVLNYLGYGIDKEILSDTYLPKGPSGSTNFYYQFVGNPRQTDSYGCYAQAIISTTNNYFSTIEPKHKIVDISGYSTEELYYEIRMGNPILIWGTINNIKPTNSTTWIVDGEKITWLAGEHCFVLIGFDLNKNTVIVSDTLNGIVEYNADLFFLRYQQMYSQALVIK